VRKFGADEGEKMQTNKPGFFGELRRAFSGIRREETIAGYLFLLPNLLGFLAFTLFPILFALYITFNDWDLSGLPGFIGFGNYTQLVSDDLFWKSLGNSFYYTFVAVPTGIFAAFCLALLMNRQIRGVLIFRTIYFLPKVTLVVASALVWNWIYHPDFGLINYLLHQVGITGPRWLHSTTWAMPAVIIMSNWMGIAPATLILLAGLQGIPQELYEAGEIDGAGAWQRLRHITLPMITPALFFVVVISLIEAMQTFSQFYIMTEGGPAYATTPLVLYAYQNAFQWYKMGYASTMAAVLFLIILVITLIQWKVAKVWVYGFE
jgi:multiple sugar transport system permease protein